MAYPASTKTLSEAQRNVDAAALSIKRVVQDLITLSAAQSVDRIVLIDLQRRLTTSIDTFNVAKVLVGMQAYARDQKQSQTLDLATEFNAMVDALVALRQWIFDNFPRSGSALLERSVNLLGESTNLQFTSAQLTNFRTEATIFVATIN